MMNIKNKTFLLLFCAGALWGPAIAASSTVDPYGKLLFTGQFKEQAFTGFNESYRIAVGDRIQLRTWGSTTSDVIATVDPQGNLFVPNIGPVKVLGTKNSELNQLVTLAVQQVYKAGLGVYAALATAQPVKLFVTGEVAKPGLYSGVNADSVLKFLDAAGGIRETGSYTKVTLLRNGAPREKFDLTQFLREGVLPSPQLQDGDVLLVGPRQPDVSVDGAVAVAARYEMPDTGLSAADVLKLARPLSSANYLLVQRSSGAKLEKIAVPLLQASQVQLQPGDQLSVYSDKHLAQVNIRIEGAHAGDSNLVLPYGATLKDALSRVSEDVRSSVANVQMFRKSVAVAQKAALLNQLRALEAMALTTRSITEEDAALKAKDAELMSMFITKAKEVQPTGQVLLKGADTSQVLLEEGDIIRIPSQTSLVSLQGDAMFPQAVAHTPGLTVAALVARSGGLLKRQGDTQVVVVNLAGEGRPVEFQEVLQPGDAVYLLPKPEVRSMELFRAVSQIVYNAAISARVLIGLR